MSTESAFLLRGVTKTFGSLPVLKEIDLRIDHGEHVALVGPSGAGKSTLIGLLNGSLYPTSGEVRTLGQDLGHLARRPERRCIKKLRLRLARKGVDQQMSKGLAGAEALVGRVGRLRL